MRGYSAVIMGILGSVFAYAGDDPYSKRPAMTATTQAGGAKLIKVLTPVNAVGQITADEGRIWFATNGGVNMLDRAAGKWRFFTRHDGLASNSIMSLAVLEGKVYAFCGFSNEVSILDGKDDKWSVKILGDKYRRGCWSAPWHFQQVRADGIWCIFTGLPDSEFGPPSAIELQQYDLKTFGLLKSVDVLKLLPKAENDKNMVREPGPSPYGLVFLEGSAWITTRDHLVKVDCKTWQTEVFPLPSEAAWEVGNDGQSKQKFPNRIYSIAAADNCLWLGLEAGLAKFDPATGKFSFLFVRNEKPYRMVGVLRQGQYLLFAGYSGPIFRMDLKTEKVETIAADVFRWIPQLVFPDGEAWGVADRPYGLCRADPKTGKVTAIRHEEFDINGNYAGPIVVFENILCSWGDRRVEKDGKENTIGGIQTFDLSADKSDLHEFNGPALMVPYKDRIWLVSFDSVTPFFPLEGRLGKTIRTGSSGLSLTGAPEIAAERDGKLYLLTHSFTKDAKNANEEQLSVFEPTSGKLELIFMMPEELRNRNGRFMGVTSAHIFLSYNDSGEHIKRFNLSKKVWEDESRKAQGFDQVCQTLDRVWWGSYDKLQACKAGDDTPAESFRIPEHSIQRLKVADDGGLEIVTQKAVLHYDGKVWKGHPLPPTLSPYSLTFAGTDRTGKPTGRYAILSYPGSPEVAVYEGKPDVVLACEAELPVTVDADGTIHVKMPSTQPASKPGP